MKKNFLGKPQSGLTPSKGGKGLNEESKTVEKRKRVRGGGEKWVVKGSIR